MGEPGGDPVPGHHGEPEAESSGPRIFYQMSDAGLPYSGDEDFMNWQRRSNTITTWDILSIVFLLGSIPAGWGLWRLTGSANLAVVGFVAALVIGFGLGFRKWWWSATGS
jgi:hypothetical protein